MEDVVDAGRHGRLRFVDSSDAARFELHLPAGAPGPMKHVHPQQQETLESIRGVLGVLHGGRTHRLQPGDAIDIPAGDPHTFWNAGDTELLLAGEVTPPLSTRDFMQEVFGLLGRYRATGGGIPLNLLRVAPVLDDYPDHLYLAGIPVTLQKKSVGALAIIARLLGYGDYSYRD